MRDSRLTERLPERFPSSRLSAGEGLKHPYFVQCLARQLTADRVLITQARLQRAAGLGREIGTGQRQTLYGPETGTPQHGVVAKVVFLARIGDVGKKDRVELVPQPPMLGEHFRKGLDRKSVV